LKSVQKIKDIYIPVLPSNAEEDRKSRAYHLPWLERIYEESLIDKYASAPGGGNISILKSFRNVNYKDKGCILQRLYISVSYSVKQFLKSTSELYRSFEGTGIEMMGIKGIRPEDRTSLIADNIGPNVRIDPGFSFTSSSATSTMTDPKRPLPHYAAYFEKKLGECIPKDQKKVFIL
jgi:hypothetical protein